LAAYNDLEKLLSSPVFNVVHFDVLAKNKNNESALDLIKMNKVKFSNQAESYTRCESLLGNSPIPQPDNTGGGCILS